MRFALLIAALVVVSPAKADKFAVLSSATLTWQSTSTPAPTAAVHTQSLIAEGPAKSAGGFYTEASLPASAQPTPMIGVDLGLRVLNPQPGEVLADYGCGFDARWLLDAVGRFGVQKAIGIEINPKISESAWRYVAHAAQAHKIDIVTGDATKVAVQADIGVAYLPPHVLANLRPQIEKLKRFVSYDYPVPGLSMTRYERDGARVYLWQKTVRVPVTQAKRVGTRLLEPGSHCEVCGGYCRRPMEHVWRQQVVGYRNVPANQVGNQVKSGGHYETRRVKVCRRGAFGRPYCSNVTQQVWVPD